MFTEHQVIDSTINCQPFVANPDDEIYMLNPIDCPYKYSNNKKTHPIRLEKFDVLQTSNLLFYLLIALVLYVILCKS